MKSIIEPSPSIHESSTLSFSDLGLSDSLEQITKDAGFEKPSEIQTQAIPHILQKLDVIAQAQTGSGKTAAYILPAIHNLKFNGKNEVLVLVPTRELAEQVIKEVERFGRSLKVGGICVIGGKPYLRQIEMLNRGAQIVVATPGRLLDHLSSNQLKRFQPDLVVLDEADEILDMGFIEDVKKILAMIPATRQTLLFSATMPKPITELAKTEMKDPIHICLVKKEVNCHQGIDQLLYLVKENERVQALSRLLRFENPTKAVIFCRTKKDADDLSHALNDQGLKTQTLHGDMSQAERQRVMWGIKNGSLKILIATDIASRGIDIDDLTHVFNFNIPENADRYVHRIGRTGRAGRQGKALTLATVREWQSHTFFRSMQSKHLKPSTIPSKGTLEQEMNVRFLAEVNKTKVSPEIEKLCRSLVTMQEGKEGLQDTFELLCRLFSYSKGETKHHEPDHIGLTSTEIGQLTTRKPAFQKSFRNERGGRNFSDRPRKFYRQR